MRGGSFCASRNNVELIVLVRWVRDAIEYDPAPRYHVGSRGDVPGGMMFKTFRRRAIDMNPAQASGGPWLAILVASAVLLAAPTARGENSPPRSGKEVVDTVCASCHGTGLHGAPKIGDEAAWKKRAAQGFTSLTQHALTGIRQMPGHGGQANLTDLEVERAVTEMVNRSGGHWVEPIATRELTKERTGEQVVKSQCVKCHEAGVGGAPKIGDRTAWVPRLSKGLDNLVRSSIHGHGGMPPRGGKADLTDAEMRNAIIYMFSPAGTVVASASASPLPQSAALLAANQMTVDGIEIHLGVVPAEHLRGFPPGSPEATMHGGVPRGEGFYHVNVSLIDAKSGAPVTGASVEVRLEQPGAAGETKALEPMGSSYGNYIRMIAHTPYTLTVRLRKQGYAGTSEARFSHEPD